MTNVHIVPVRETKRTGVKFVLGRIRYRPKEPEKYKVKVVMKGRPKVAIGQKGIYVLNDELIEALLKESWENHLREHRSRNIRTKKEVVEPPIEVSEEELRSFLSKKGVSSLLEVGWINLSAEVPDFKRVADIVKGVIELAKEEVGAP